MKAPAVVGKVLPVVVPVTYALPCESTAIPKAPSSVLEPSRVEYESTGSMTNGLLESLEFEPDFVSIDDIRAFYFVATTILVELVDHGFV